MMFLREVINVYILREGALFIQKKRRRVSTMNFMNEILFFFTYIWKLVSKLGIIASRLILPIEDISTQRNLN